MGWPALPHWIDVHRLIAAVRKGESPHGLAEIASGLLRDKKPARATWIVALCMTLIVMSIVPIGAALWIERTAMTEAGKRFNESIAAIIDEQTVGVIHAAERELMIARDKLNLLRATGSLTEAAVQEVLQAAIDSLPYLRAVGTLNALGRYEYSTRSQGPLGEDASDREYFLVHKDNPNSGFYLNAPTQSERLGTWVASTSLPMRSPDGQFNGVILAALELEAFERLWRQVDIGENGVIALGRSDGTLIVRSPFNAEALGKKFPFAARLPKLIEQAPSGSTTAISPIDGTERLISYRLLKSQPDLVLFVGRAVNVILAPWWHFVTITASAWVVSVSAIAALFYWLLRIWNREQRTQLLFRRLSESMPQIVFVNNSKGETLYINQHWSDVTGRPQEDAQMLGWSEYVHPQDVDRARAKWLQAAKDASAFSDEYRLRLKDGTYRWFLARAVPIRDDLNALDCWFGTAMDIDDIRQAELRVRESEAEFHSLFDDLPVGISDTTGDGGIIAVNAAWRKMYGFGETDDLTVINVTELYADSAIRIRWLDELMHKDRVGEMEILRKRRDGTQFWAEMHARCIVNAKGQLQKIRSIHVDITSRKSLEDQLRQSQKMEAVGQLTGGIAHDFNNLLTVVLGNAETLAESLTDNPRLKHLAELVTKSAQRGADLTSGLLAFARKQTLRLKVMNIHDLVSRMDGLLRQALGEHIEIKLVRGSGLGNATVDPAQLEATILNLALNARDAMPNGGTLTIETADVELDQDYARANEGVKPGPYVMVSVSDTGTGMTPEVAAKAFDPFFTTKEVGKGTGLGLSMVYGLIKQSDGHVKIYSEVGHGTTVKLYLPRSIEADEAIAPRGEPAEVRGGSETILIVEDDDMVRTYVESQLASLGYRVLTTRNGQEALEVLHQDRPVDLLFTDVVMPGGMNGPQLAEAARRLRPTLKVLYTSGYAENSIGNLGRIGHGVDLLSKPYQRHHLAAKLRKVLEARSDPS
jgi:PAS domain S-box-containing protein